MRIATFNLENLSGNRAATGTLSEKYRVLRSQLKRLAADIVCLQEVGADRDGNKSHAREFTALSALLADTPYANYFLAHSMARDGHGPLDVHNLVTLSRYPIFRYRQLWNDLVAPPRYQIKTAKTESTDPEEIKWDRPVLHAEIDLGTGRLLHVFNLHLRAPLASFIPGQKLSEFKWRTTSGWAEGFFIAAIKRNGQALETRFAIDQLFSAQPDALIVVCGDMNAENQEMPLRILQADDRETENSALSGQLMIPMERAAPDARRYTVIHGGQPIMLDHMLVSHPLFDRFQTIEIHNEDLSDEMIDYKLGRNKPVSHHAPIVANFTFDDLD